MLKKLGIALLVLIVGTVVVIAVQPADFRVTRSAVLPAPAPAVFGLLTDFRAWGSWSPWEKLDPGMQKTFSGAPKGEGAVYEWSGNDQVGRGRMEIVDVREHAQVTIDLQFITPFEAKNLTVFTLTPRGPEEVEVTWSMSGKNNFMGKAIGLFMDMDALIGKDFEKGLADLGRAARAASQAAK